MASDAIPRPKPKPGKTVIIIDGDRLCYAGFVNSEQEKKIMLILMSERRKLAQ